MLSIKIGHNKMDTPYLEEEGLLPGDFNLEVDAGRNILQCALGEVVYWFRALLCLYSQSVCESLTDYLTDCLPD